MVAPFTAACLVKWNLTRNFAAAIAFAAVPLSPMIADEPQEKQNVTVTVSNASASSDDQETSDRKEGNKNEQTAPKLWLGIMLKNIEGDLASYLDRTEGVLIESVFPESPAAAAGLKKGDVLLKFSTKEVSEPSDVLTVMKEITVTEVDEPKELEVIVLRKGEEVELTLTPALRPAKHQAITIVEETETEDGNSEAQADNNTRVFSFAFSDDQPLEEVQALIEKMKQGVDNEVQIFQLGNPTIRVSPDGEIAEMPGQKMEAVIKKDVNGKQLDITIKRDGEGPAKITVTTDGETSEYTAEQLEKMSPEVREIVEPVLTKKENRVLKLDSDGLKWKATIDGEEVKQMVEKYQRLADEMRLKASAEVIRAQAKAAASKVRAHAEATAAEALAQSNAERVEVAQLKQLVDELRAEVKELRQKLEEK